jgi:hypothetical protein
MNGEIKKSSNPWEQKGVMSSVDFFVRAKFESHPLYNKDFFTKIIGKYHLK